MKIITSCKEASRLMSKNQEGPLTIKERFSLHFHLYKCKSCLYVYKQVKKLKTLFGNYSESMWEVQPTESQSLPKEARQRIKSSLKNQ